MRWIFFVNVSNHIFVRYIELYINIKTTSIRPLIITYKGTLKSKKTNIPLLNSSMQNTLEDSAFSITELRSCFDEIPSASINGVPKVMSAPMAIIHCVRPFYKKTSTFSFKDLRKTLSQNVMSNRING